MRVGDQEGMQHFDREIEKLIRSEVVALDVGLAYSTNPGNLRLELADFAPVEANRHEASSSTEIELE